jgi:hypothetical protein
MGGQDSVFRDQVDVPSARRALLSGKARTSTLFHAFGKVTHGLLRDATAFAARKGSFRAKRTSARVRSWRRKSICQARLPKRFAPMT